MEAILTERVQNSLRLFMFKNAIFLCERLFAEFPSEVNLQLLAACYLQNNQAYSAYHILKGTQTAQSRYLFAISCFQMDLLSEAETALCHANEPGGEIPNGAAGHYLLGLIYRYTDRKKSAIHHFRLALSIDPLLWAAYEELSVLGAAEEATAVFGEAAALCIQKQYLHQGEATLQISSEDYNLVSSRNFASEDACPRQVKHTQGNSYRDILGNNHGAAVSSGAASQPQNDGPSPFYNTPSPMASQLSGVAPPPLCRNVQPNGSNLNKGNTDGSPRSVVNTTIQAPRRKFVDEGKLRKISGRLFSNSGPRRSTRLSGDSRANTNANASVVAGNGTNNSSKYLGSSKLSSVALRKGQSRANENIEEGLRTEAVDDARANMVPVTSSSVSSGDVRSHGQDGATVLVGGVVISGSKVISGASEVLCLLRTLGEGYRLSCLYRCQDALDTYLRLPHKHYNTGWVMSQVGKAHFELVDYLEAEQAFSLARRVSPYSLEGMDVYSTVLYHLKEDMKLSYLAQELISTDRLAPQSWCAVGNCYSLQKDHETSLKNFQRAVQLNPRFAYAHTLCGHEYVALEDFENGIKSYQNALCIDYRHYNAWYGLGMIYLRQEKFEFSEHHFGMAFQINPRSSVIMSFLGTALHALKKSEDAIEIMDRAILADKKNPLPMYQKANILMSLEKFDDALEVLEDLKEYAPHESSVHALMGKIFKRRNMHEKAMLHFGIALDLKPSAIDVATIKAAIEKLHVPDELDDNL
ncbi:Cell division cycle protein 27-like protein B [Hibiscus syriacus]|uniref:Cell division cycle protein 27-like protein B n=1 Tax=Hibiscus syriacus TaxID=106335 RepID=A0A6A3BB18_HIBSY|nr:cell division cycle protein 27 homolog B-like [Hibiscus syriacus]KAE8714134.1 Cell division cycle protein 27-like protein B [Hibiscus syriacus]